MHEKGVISTAKCRVVEATDHHLTLALVHPGSQASGASLTVKWYCEPGIRFRLIVTSEKKSLTVPILIKVLVKCPPNSFQPWNSHLLYSIINCTWLKPTQRKDMYGYLEQWGASCSQPSGRAFMVQLGKPKVFCRVYAFAQGKARVVKVACPMWSWHSSAVC